MSTPKTFSMDDQRWFAALSGDHNPLHVDELAARRLMFGGPVVHGVHVVCWALEELLSQYSSNGSRWELGQLRFVFASPVKLGQAVQCEPKGPPSEFTIELRSGARVLARVLGTLRKVPAARAGSTAAVAFARLREAQREPRNLTFVQAAAARGSIPLYADLEALRARYSRLVEALPPVQLAVLITTTRLVGMVCPGLHSIYSEGELEFDAEARPASVPTDAQLEYEAIDADERFSHIPIHVRGPLAKGRLLSCLRPAPVRQEAMTELAREVRSGEFAGQRAWVIGGSRGVGETVAKLIAAGGGDVRVSYARGKDDALRVVSEIQAAGARARAFEYDVTRAAQAVASITEGFGPGWLPTHVYYCASPFIFIEARGRFEYEHFLKFSDAYVRGLLDTTTLLQGLRGKSPQGQLTVVNWSSSALEENPANMGAYAAAKAASEALGNYLSAHWKGVSVASPRIPRLHTDQTANLFSVPAQKPAQALLPILRALA